MALPWETTGNDEWRRWADAIAGVESGGRRDPYSARGPLITNPRNRYYNQRALGRYQVMPGNLGQWLSEAGMADMTPDAFLADANAQDQLFRHRFGGYVNRYGNLDDAASMWFTGQPYSRGRSSTDTQPGSHRGISGEQYVARFNEGLGTPFGVPRIPPGPRVAGWLRTVGGQPDSDLGIPDWAELAARNPDVMTLTRPDEVSNFRPRSIDTQREPPTPFGPPVIPPGPNAQTPPANQPNYFDRLMGNPAFLAGLSILGTAPGGNWGPNAAQAMQAAVRGRREQEEYERTRRHRTTMERVWAEAFPNGRPNAQHPLLQGVTPDVAAAVYAMGPDAGIAALGRLAMTRNVRAPFQTVKLGDGTEVSVRWDAARNDYVLPDGQTLTAAMGGTVSPPPPSGAIPPPAVPPPTTGGGDRMIFPGLTVSGPPPTTQPPPAVPPPLPGPGPGQVTPPPPVPPPSPFGFGNIGPSRRVAGILGGLERLAQVPVEFGTDATERAIGPWAGADVGATNQGFWSQAANFLPSLIARIPGEIDAASRGGAPGSEVRNRIAGDMQALAASIKPLIRRPGEGTWTDADQRKLESIIGNLASARTVPEYMRQLEAVRQRIIANFGLAIPELRPQPRSANPPPLPGRERTWGQMWRGTTPEMEEAEAEQRRLNTLLLERASRRTNWLE
jgi:hypothetical protein